MRMITAETITRGAYTGHSPIASGLTEALTMPDVTSIVFVVDDDVSVRESLELLIKSAGWRSETFASAQEFLSHPRAMVPCCLVLDVTLPGLNGLDLQQQLADRTDMPIIFITAQGDQSLRPRLVARGAVACLFKPFSDTAMIEALNSALRMR